MSFNDSEQLPFKGDPKKENSPGLASGYNDGASALPGGNPKRDVNAKDSTTNTLNDQGGDLGYLKGD